MSLSTLSKGFEYRRISNRTLIGLKKTNKQKTSFVYGLISVLIHLLFGSFYVMNM